MKDGKMTELDAQVSYTIYRICNIWVMKDKIDEAVEDIKVAKRAICGTIPGLTPEQVKEQVCHCDDAVSSLHMLSEFLLRQANRLEDENITRLELFDPREGKE